MINIYLSYIHCDEETDEVGADDPYVLVAAVALTPSLSATRAQAAVASDVIVYPFRRMFTGGRPAFGIFEPFWGIGGTPASLTNPNDAIFIVAMNENDDGDPQIARGLVDTAVNASLVESLALPRAGKVRTLMRDLDSARRLPTGFPNFDDAIGDPQELIFSADELQRAEAGNVVTKTMAFEGDGGRYTLQFDARNPDRWRRWFQIHPETIFDRASQRVTGVSRRSDQMDLFVIGFDNAVWSTFWNAQGGWNADGWFQIHPETVFDHTTQRITAVSRNPDQLDLFVVGFDNAVWSTFWNAQGGWNAGGWFQIHPETVFDHTTQRITTVSRNPDQLDLFVIGFDNAVWSTFWNAQGGWNAGGWFQIHPETVFDRATQEVAAICRTPDNMDLFVVGFDNALWSAWWSPG